MKWSIATYTVAILMKQLTNSRHTNEIASQLIYSCHTNETVNYNSYTCTCHCNEIINLYTAAIINFTYIQLPC